MLKDILRDVVSSIIGKQAEGAVDLLYDSGYVNEFLIAKKMDMTINQVRNILYKLSDYGLVSSTRKKDKKKGWYTYFWKLEVLKCLEFLRKIIEKNIENLINQIKSRETKQFFICSRCNLEFNEENALLKNFTCGECGEVFQLKDNSKVLKDLNRSLNKMSGELKLIDDEITQEKAKVEKKKVSDFKREEKKKAKAKKGSKKVQQKIKKSSKKIKKVKKKTKSKSKKVSKKKTNKSKKHSKR